VSRLSPAQELAATQPGCMLVAACPGAGKTTVLSYRAENRLRSKPGARLAAVTFTAEAAASLKARIIKKYPEAAKLVDTGTFHSLCMVQLRRAGAAKPLIGEGKSAMWIRLAMEACPMQEAGLDLAACQAKIQEWQRITSEPIPGPDSGMAAWVHHHYAEQKRKHGVRDFGDLILDAVIGMRSGTVEPLDVGFMLVDEFQDTDNMQLEWVLEHARRGVEVTIVGDDDQAIYGWRGSLGYEGMMRFQREAQAAMVTLDRTFRCTVDVLRPAAVLISHNTARVAKKLVTSNPDSGKVRVRAFEDRDKEVSGILSMIRTAENPDECCVIARTNGLLDEVETRLSQQGIPYSRSGGRSFWDQKAPGMLMSLASSMARRDMLGVGELLQHAKVRRSTLDEWARSCDSTSQGPSIGSWPRSRLADPATTAT
jgi:Superfamily I DNA and RNA helicases